MPSEPTTSLLLLAAASHLWRVSGRIAGFRELLGQRPARQFGRAWPYMISAREALYLEAADLCEKGAKTTFSNDHVVARRCSPFGSAHTAGGDT